MTLRLILRRHRAARTAALLLALPLAAGAQHGAGPTNAARAPAPPVIGLIVQLRDAPSHVLLARERALGVGAGGAAHSEAQRWQQLLADLRDDRQVQADLPGWTRQAPRRDPVGERAQLLRFDQPLSAEQAERVAARVAARPDVAWVAANTRERRQATAANAPNDPLYPGNDGQWWLQPVKGSDGSVIADRLRGVAGFLPAWLNSSNGSAAAVVAVLDSGITCHPDLGNVTSPCIGGAILPGYDFVSDWDPVAQRGYANDGDGRDADPRDPGDWVSAADRSADPARYGSCDVEDSTWHGTVIAGMVAARTNNAAGVAAINWNGQVLPVRVAGKCGADVADIIDGMRWAAGLQACKRSDGAGGCAEFAPANPNPARIINISFGGSAVCGAAYQQAIDEVRAAPGGGAVVVAAAGNGWGAPSRPASCERVIGVAALNRDGFKANYSNFGAALAIATVGGDDSDGAWGSSLGANRVDDSGILSIGNSGTTAPAAAGYYNHFGTSFATPGVSGAISLMLSVRPDLTVDQIMQGLGRSARPHVVFPAGVANLGPCSAANPGRCQCTAATCGAGILDMPQALLYATDPASYVNTRGFGEVVDTAELRAGAALGPDRPANTPPPVVSSGGGALTAGWLVGLLAATALLWSGSVSAASRRRSDTLRSRPRARR